MLTFALRHQFSQADLDTIELLVKDHDAKFHAAYKGLYRKPKHHFLRHLRKYMNLYGPLRGFWCMSGEAFLQQLKRMFEACNYKTAPHTVLSMWNQRRELRLRRGSRPDEANLEWDSNALASFEMARAASSSQVQTLHYNTCYTHAALMLHTHVMRLLHACYMHATCQ